MSIIEFDGARFTYDGTGYALDSMDLHIERGEFVCVLGGNGSGKSTLAKHVNALIAPDKGSVHVLGRDTREPDNLYFIRSNAGMVFQNPDDQIVASTIEDDVAFGPENLGVPLPELRERVTRALEQVGLQGFETRETTALSGGQKQRVAIAGALAMEPQILVFDEASAMLDPRGRAGLLRVCRELNATGFTIVYITHFMEEAVQADRVIVLAEGRVTLSGAPDEVLTQVERLKELHLDVPFAAQMSFALRDRGMPIALHVKEEALEQDLGRLLGQEKMECVMGGAREIEREHNAVRSAGGDIAAASTQPACDKPVSCEGALYPNELASSFTSANASGEFESAANEDPLIRLKNVSFTYEPSPHGKRRRKVVETGAKPAKWGNDPNEHWALREVSLDVKRNDFLGLAGHTGSGKSTLIQLAAGLMHPTAGNVTISGVDLADKRAAREIRGSVGLVFQYPERQLFAATVFDDVAFGPKNLGLSSAEVETRVREALSMVHLELDDLRERSPFTLSGGQQRRIAIAGVLAMEPQVLIMDEPTAGLDPQSREALLELVSELHDTRKLTIVLVSHSMDDLAKLCERVVLLNRGKIVGEGTPAEVFADEGAMKAIGLGVPRTLHWAKKLGMEAGRRIPTIDELADVLAKLPRRIHG